MARVIDYVPVRLRIEEQLPRRWQTEARNPQTLVVQTIFLAITPSGLTEALRAAAAAAAIWCSSDPISEEDYESSTAHDLSRFNHGLGDRELIDDAIITIEEHHPGQTIWIEAKPSE